MATIEGHQLQLTGEEFQIVEFLALRRGSVLSKTNLLSHLYDGMDEPESKIIYVFICKLRRKLEIASTRGMRIDRVWGQGYILRETEAVSQTPEALPSSIDDLSMDQIDAGHPFGELRAS